MTNEIKSLEEQSFEEQSFEKQRFKEHNLEEHNREEKDELQKWAEELAGLDRNKDGARIATLEKRIVERELGQLASIAGRAHFPLLKKHQGSIPFDDFYDILIDVLLELLHGYRPEKAAFTTALAFLLHKRIAGYWEKVYREKGRNGVYIDQSDEEGHSPDIPDPTDFTEQSSAFELFMRVVPLIILRKKQEKHLSKTGRNYFEGFCTFDTTVQTKSGLFDANQVIVHNELLFPVMELVVLEYLEEGTFAHMHDVVRNKVKDEQRTTRRNEAMQVCYSLTKPTVVSRNKRYRELFDAVKV